jgi:CHAT domain-containing protein
LGPAKAQLRGKSSIFIVPDSVLWEMPFQALQSASGRYLAEDGAISYGPSSTVLREMFHLQTAKSADKNSLPRLLAFGNPEFKVVRNNSKQDTHRASLTALPEAEREVKLLGQLYGNKPNSVYIGIQASEDRLKKEVGEYDVLHLATHGIVNNSSPLYSHLLLAKPKHGEQEDGLLEAWEIMKLKIRTDLVVLSSCETALGKVGAGEGMLGLTWSLFVAGSAAMVVSQWKVDSESTAALMLEFHRNLKMKRFGKSEALRQAALKLRQDPMYRHPYYWAGFIVVGDPSPL